MSVPRDAPILVAGHTGLVGSAIVRKLERDGFSQILRVSSATLDLRDQAAVNRWFAEHRPRYVYLVAGTVGGIQANATRPATFLYDNLMIHANVVHASHLTGVSKLLYLGSSCIYPREAPQPIPEEALLTGPLEPTNEGYAVAKIAGIKLCSTYRTQFGDNFIAAMPTNLYGPGDNFDLEASHVVPALIRRFDEARARGERDLVVWGTGSARRELLHVDDLATACLYLMDNYESAAHINVGTGEDLSIGEIASLIRDIVHPDAALTFDATKPDGMPRKVLDVSRLHALGWKHTIELAEGLESTYRWFVANRHRARGVSPQG